MLPARWFHLRDGVQEGPVDLEAIRGLVQDGDVGPDTWVWADGMPSWMPAHQVPALVPPPELGLPGWSATEQPSQPPTAC